MNDEGVIISDADILKHYRLGKTLGIGSFGKVGISVPLVVVEFPFLS